MPRLDSYGAMPTGLSDYLSLYGWHFSKKLCEYAVSKMRKRKSATSKESEKITPYTKEQVDEMLKRQNIELEHDAGYDAVFVANMLKSDYSQLDEQKLAYFVRDYLDDIDGYDGIALTRYYADCVGKGEPVIWQDMI